MLLPPHWRLVHGVQVQPRSVPSTGSEVFPWPVIGPTEGSLASPLDDTIGSTTLSSKCEKSTSTSASSARKRTCFALPTPPVPQDLHQFRVWADSGNASCEGVEDESVYVRDDALVHYKRDSGGNNPQNDDRTMSSRTPSPPLSDLAQSPHFSNEDESIVSRNKYHTGARNAVLEPHTSNFLPLCNPSTKKTITRNRGENARRRTPATIQPIQKGERSQSGHGKIATEEMHPLERNVGEQMGEDTLWNMVESKMQSSSLVEELHRVGSFRPNSFPCQETEAQTAQEKGFDACAPIRPDSLFASYPATHREMVTASVGEHEASFTVRESTQPYLFSRDIPNQADSFSNAWRIEHVSSRLPSHAITRSARWGDCSSAAHNREQGYFDSKVPVLSAQQIMKQLKRKGYYNK